MVKTAAIIFDLDGTLLDTLQDIATAANAVLRRHGGVEHPLQNYAGFVGEGVRVLVQRIFPGHQPPPLLDLYCRHFLEAYEDYWDHHCQPYAGIVEMLSQLAAAALPMAVLSNKPHPLVLRFVERYFPDGMFSQVYGERPGVARKPDPTAALDIAGQLRVDPSKMLFVGDTPIDIQTGKAAGMKTAAVTWGFRSPSELVTEQPDLLINHPSELVEHVLASF